MTMHPIASAHLLTPSIPLDDVEVLDPISESWIQARVKSVGQSPALSSGLSLPGYENKIRSLGNSLHRFVNVKTLDLSHNALKSLTGLDSLVHLQSLTLYYNLIEEVREVHRLRAHPNLRRLDVRLNPFCHFFSDYRRYIIHVLPLLKVLDEVDVNEVEVVDAENAYGEFDPNDMYSKTRKGRTRNTSPDASNSAKTFKFNIADVERTNSEMLEELKKIRFPDMSLSPDDFAIRKRLSENGGKAEDSLPPFILDEYDGANGGSAGLDAECKQFLKALVSTGQRIRPFRHAKLPVDGSGNPKPDREEIEATKQYLAVAAGFIVDWKTRDRVKFNKRARDYKKLILQQQESIEDLSKQVSLLKENMKVMQTQMRLGEEGMKSTIRVANLMSSYGDQQGEDKGRASISTVGSTGFSSPEDHRLANSYARELHDRTMNDVHRIESKPSSTDEVVSESDKFLDDLGRWHRETKMANASMKSIKNVSKSKA